MATIHETRQKIVANLNKAFGGGFRDDLVHFDHGVHYVLVDPDMETKESLATYQRVIESAREHGIRVELAGPERTDLWRTH
jgi:hypothetical protein